MTVNSASSSSLFENPNNLSLEHLKLTIKNDGVIQTVDALSAHWVENRTLSYYVSPPNKNETDLNALQTWKDTMQNLIEDLKWLLSLEYHKFWSNVIHHPSCMNMLVSFLQEARPPYIQIYDDKSVADLYDEVYRRVLIIFSRLVTNKEGEDKWMENTYLGEILYEKFIFTIPIIWDLCLLYGIPNRAHVTKLLDSVFYLQPKYYDDLNIAIDFLKQVTEFISMRINKNTSNLLPEVFKGFSKNFCGRQMQTSNANEDLSFAMIYDFVLHILDSAITMRLFLELHEPARKIFREKEYYTTIVNFYDTTITKMYERIQDLHSAEGNSSNEVFNYLDYMRIELIESFRFIISSTIDEILSGTNIEENVQIYLTIITDALSEKHFIKDYHSSYPVDVDLDILCQSHQDMDPVKCDFILQAVYANCDEQDNKIHKFVREIETNNIPNNTQNHSRSQSPIAANHGNDIPEEAKTQSLISEVRDILPDLGDGYILKCLEFYGFNTEQVINCILEGNLDKSLQDLDPQLPIIPLDPLDEQYLKTGIDRHNIFDNDEFDIMTRDNIDMSRVYRGKKKSKHKNLSDMLNDKSYINQMKDTYAKYGLVNEDTDLYDDEYDDTYDDAARDLVGKTVSEIDRKTISNKAVLFKDMDDNQEESEEESDENTSVTQNNPKDPNHFCVNPEEIRARYQARREQKYGHKSNNERDVVGKAKGQGQDKEVLLNRQKKATNKSVRANHNRRSGAQWKRNQGMMPS